MVFVGNVTAKKDANFRKVKQTFHSCYFNMLVNGLLIKTFFKKLLLYKFRFTFNLTLHVSTPPPIFPAQIWMLSTIWLPYAFLHTPSGRTRRSTSCSLDGAVSPCPAEYNKRHYDYITNMRRSRRRQKKLQKNAKTDPLIMRPSQQQIHAINACTIIFKSQN